MPASGALMRSHLHFSHPPTFWRDRPTSRPRRPPHVQTATAAPAQEPAPRLAPLCIITHQPGGLRRRPRRGYEMPWKKLRGHLVRLARRTYGPEKDLSLEASWPRVAGRAVARRPSLCLP